MLELIQSYVSQLMAGTALWATCAIGMATASAGTKPAMRVDKLSNAEKYHALHPRFAQAFAFLKNTDLKTLSMGRHEIDGDRLYCIAQKGGGRKRSESSLEAHRKYIDIQYIIDGADEMGWKPIGECQKIKKEYDAAKDIQFFADQVNVWKKVPAGSFAIFFPQDAHAPMVSDGEIWKIVLKVAVE